MPPRKNNPNAPFVAKPQPQQGRYSDRIKIEPKYGMEQQKLPSDTEIHRQMETDVRTA